MVGQVFKLDVRGMFICDNSLLPMSQNVGIMDDIFPKQLQSRRYTSS